MAKEKNIGCDVEGCTCHLVPTTTEAQLVEFMDSATANIHDASMTDFEDHFVFAFATWWDRENDYGERFVVYSDNTGQFVAWYDRALQCGYVEALLQIKTMNTCLKQMIYKKSRIEVVLDRYCDALKASKRECSVAALTTPFANYLTPRQIKNRLDKFHIEYKQ